MTWSTVLRRFPIDVAYGVAVLLAAGWITRRLLPEPWWWPLRLSSSPRHSFTCSVCGWWSGPRPFSTLAPQRCPSCGQTNAEGYHVRLETLP